MDTRSKILSIDAAARMLASGNWLVVAGLFDPMTATQARRLEDLSSNGRKLLAIVLESDDALFKADARAALVAALREVHAVAITAPGEWRAVIQPDACVEILEDEAGERARSAEFVQFVLRRQNA